MFRFRSFPLAFVLLLLLASCGAHASHGVPDLVPTLCHREPSVGLLFITIENRGSDAGPSTTGVAFETQSPRAPHVRLHVATPAVPSRAEIWVAVELPYAPGTSSFLLPAGNLTITTNAGNASPGTAGAHNVLITACNDQA
jgi:hypothetical protein